MGNLTARVLKTGVMSAGDSLLVLPESDGI